MEMMKELCSTMATHCGTLIVKSGKTLKEINTECEGTEE